MRVRMDVGNLHAPSASWPHSSTEEDTIVLPCALRCSIKSVMSCVVVYLGGPSESSAYDSQPRSCGRSGRVPCRCALSLCRAGQLSSVLATIHLTSQCGHSSCCCFSKAQAWNRLTNIKVSYIGQVTHPRSAQFSILSKYIITVFIFITNC
jgi:hypothetical protein